ncbi:glycosyltransferase [Desulfopila aestuarii]|uniref:Glycosyltransferase involved in cell wall bisynthesis n=1 Tax=Desulfopila aestuarii DSM 18488 TaxID=1121416 RepID=A0A1M7YFT2_9BACT|nr:glycosyltransferase [Desulfopila aestuarii]SHO51473.1 Glycosyltransferase involved in cell wall bisynthesis [Desulfopila aestuarii DSM 18488]
MSTNTHKSQEALINHNLSKSICIVAHFAYGSLVGDLSGHIGGVERQTSSLALWLAKNGYKVRILTWDEGQREIEDVNGVTVIKMCPQNSGLPILRFFHPRWTSLCQALKKANADIYYQNCAEYVTGQVSLWCKLNNRKFVYSVASDPDCLLDLPKMKSYREKVLYRYGLHNANKIIVQTKKQQKMILENFGRNSEIINMPCQGLSISTSPSKFEERYANRILWVGRIAPVKRLEWLLDIADMAPDLFFEIIGPLDNSEYSLSLTQRISKMPNVYFRGAKGRSELSAYYSNCALLCCTSSYEGFPNTFLEAWSYGMPVVSTIDPDNLIKSKHLGDTGASPKELLSSILLLLNDPSRWKSASLSARNYYLQNHNEDNILPLLVNTIFNHKN